MKKNNILLTKKEIYTSLGFKSMEMVYKKILVEDMVISLGFESLEEFKRAKLFSLKETRRIRKFISKLQSESFKP